MRAGILGDAGAGGWRAGRGGDGAARARRREAAGRVDLDAPGLGEAIERAVAPGEAAVRRAFDVAAALLCLVLLAPLMLVLAALIRLDSPGGAIYRQERVGLGGRRFTILKFRSMRVDAEAAGSAWTGDADPRVTRVGRVMRRARLDELPQLVNVLRGEMALIGPRPERPCFAARIAAEVPLFARRTAVKPGLTGWAQVRAGYAASVEDSRLKLAHDLWYIANRSARLDLRILLDTVRVVFTGQGAR